VPQQFLDRLYVLTAAFQERCERPTEGNVAVTGAAQTEESALKSVLDEDQSEIHIALASFWRMEAGRFFGAGFVN
jgi:hypothetical protein